MKSAKTIVFVLILGAFTSQSHSQNINWKNLKSEQKHVIHIGIGWDYGLVYGVGYGYQLNSKIPVILNASYSFPSGKNLADDFKTKLGAQALLYRNNNIQMSASINAIYRRYENPLVCLKNFGGEIMGNIGYYKSKWFVGVDFGFDKAIATHFKHSASFKENVYSDVKDGWARPATGGNFSYGIQTGYSFNRSDITFEIGKVTTQDFKTAPLIPYYLQLGYNHRIASFVEKNK
jgi:hypothetical protein